MKKLKFLKNTHSITLWLCRIALLFTCFESFSAIYLKSDFRWWVPVVCVGLFGVSVLLNVLIQKVVEILTEEKKLKNLHKAAGTVKFSDRVNRAYRQKV